MKRTKRLLPKKPIQRSSSLKRSTFRPGKGRVGRLRQIGNAGARLHYFKHHSYDDLSGWAPCQVCGEAMSEKMCEAHHKSQKGEELENKLVAHPDCHKVFVHDLNHREHRVAAKASPVNVITGGKVDWTAAGLGEAFDRFLVRRRMNQGIGAGIKARP